MPIKTIQFDRLSLSVLLAPVCVTCVCAYACVYVCRVCSHMGVCVCACLMKVNLYFAVLPNASYKLSSTDITWTSSNII